jgi:hypothetical protein
MQSPSHAINQMSCTFRVPSLIEYPTKDNEAVYAYCDMHKHWPDGNSTQFVPQLMRGLVFDTCDASYNCKDTQVDHWVIQAQYLVFVKGSVYGVTGDIIPVKPGDEIKTRIYYGTSQDGTKSYSAQISVGPKVSQVVVTSPFLGKNPNFPDAFGTNNPLYYQYQLGDLWESWGMDTMNGYPSNFKWNVSWEGDRQLGFRPQYDKAISGVKAAVVSQSAGQALGVISK